MLAGAKKLLLDISCEDDENKVFCTVRVIGSSGAAILFANSTYMTVAHGQFDAVSFASGVAAIAAAVGAGVGIKSKLGG